MWSSPRMHLPRDGYCYFSRFKAYALRNCATVECHKCHMRMEFVSCTFICGRMSGIIFYWHHNKIMTCIPIMQFNAGVNGATNVSNISIGLFISLQWFLCLFAKWYATERLLIYRFASKMTYLVQFWWSSPWLLLLSIVFIGQIQ